MATVRGARCRRRRLQWPPCRVDRPPGAAAAVGELEAEHAREHDGPARRPGVVRHQVARDPIIAARSMSGGGTGVAT